MKAYTHAYTRISHIKSAACRRGLRRRPTPPQRRPWRARDCRAAVSRPGPACLRGTDICTHVHASTRVHASKRVHACVHPCVQTHALVPVVLPTYLHIHPPARPPNHPSISQSVYTSLSLSLSLSPSLSLSTSERLSPPARLSLSLHRPPPPTVHPPFSS